MSVVQYRETAMLVADERFLLSYARAAEAVPFTDEIPPPPTRASLTAAAPHPVSLVACFRCSRPVCHVHLHRNRCVV